MSKTIGGRRIAEAEIRERYERVKDKLDERSRRLFVGSEALAYGHGGIQAVAHATGVSRATVSKGVNELRAMAAGTHEGLEEGRIRRAGGGRKKATVKDPTLLSDLRALVEEATRGDPESSLLWTARSLRNLVSALQEQGHRVQKNTVAGLLKELGYRLQGNKKCLEGAQHPDRNAQFEHINEMVRAQLAANEPAISVDTKKKELVGPYKNGGRELRAQQDPERVLVHDFPAPQQPKAIPYGVYDLAENEAWVSVGLSHDTGEFAVATIRIWFDQMGRPRYPNASSLLIVADGGGSNGYRLRLWKVELQRLANDLGLPITVCHLPPGTSKWNKIEHRLFSFISQNWRGKPLVTYQVIVELIAATKTQAGLRVESRLDECSYTKGRRISDTQLAEVNLVPYPFHGEWNYTIHPSFP
jgi:transposase